MTYYSVNTLFTTCSFEKLEDAETYFEAQKKDHSYVELMLIEDYKYYYAYSLRIYSK